MNVLLIGDGDTKYGASHSLCQLASSLNKMDDLNVTVIVNKDSSLADEMRNAGCKVYVLPYQPFYQGVSAEKWKVPIKYVIRGFQYWAFRLIAIPATKRIFRENRFDIIHSNSSREDLGAILANHYQIPLVWHIREFGDRDYRCYSYRRNFISYMNKSARKFIAVSNAVKNHWISKGIDPGRIVTVYNGVRLIELPKRIETDEHKRSIVMMGSIQITKGQKQAVEAVILVNQKDPAHEYTLDLIGDGEKRYIAEIKEIIKKNKAENQIRLLGYISDSDKLLPSYDMGLVCSKDEAFGRVTAEYMMAGLPVIASDTGANQELIREGIDGMIYHWNDPEDLSSKIILAGNGMGKIGGEQTHSYANKAYSSIVNAINIQKIYKER